MNKPNDQVKGSLEPILSGYTPPPASLFDRHAVGGIRYSWNDDPEKTRILIRLATNVLAQKKPDSTYITGAEWEYIVVEYNRLASEPVDNLKILHNKMAILRTQCKEYHEVVSYAKNRGLLILDINAWNALGAENPALLKWRYQSFEYYKEMVLCLKLVAPNDFDDEWYTKVKLTLPSPTNNLSSEEREKQLLLLRRREERQRRTAEGKRKRREEQQSRLHTPAKLQKGPSQTSAESTTNESSSSCMYSLALEHVASLHLSLEDRVDAKRFLVDERNAKIFVFLEDDEERRAYLNKYCYDLRDTERRVQFES